MRLPLALVVVFLALAACPVAWSASLERLVMPGPVIEGHAELEDDCDSCHANFDAGRQDALCLDCHEDIAADLVGKMGLHGRIDKLNTSGTIGACKRCHTEHQGRAADIVGLNAELFDHGLTDFALDGAHASGSCSGCHEEDQPHRSAPQECVACHVDDDPHEGNLGEDCAACHTTEGWPVPTFDHGSTAFALRGGHVDVGCRSCHLEETFQSSKACVSCHGKDDVHAGRRGDDCADCHGESGWAGASFDHRVVTGYGLEGTHATLVCASCHLNDMEIPEPPTTCNECHSANDPHQGRNGVDCGQCHDQQSWNDTRFDHLAETGFELLGGHDTLACEGCHRGRLTDPLETGCADCHADDDPHAGVYPDCQGCHTPAAWWDVAFNHDFTDFPLIGWHKLVACESCHVDDSFQGADKACFDCHEGSDRHDGTFSPHCQRCHNPNGWSRWQFDHDQDTTFPLDGRHADLECDGCHRSNVWETQSLASCASCHVADDVHEGRFGDNCVECHTTESFDDIRPFRR